MMVMAMMNPETSNQGLQCSTDTPLASISMLPQLALGSWIPSPKKLKLLSPRMYRG